MGGRRHRRYGVADRFNRCCLGDHSGRAWGERYCRRRGLGVGRRHARRPLVRIDPSTDSVKTTITVGSRPRGVAWGDGSIWVANGGDGTFSRVDPQTNRVVATIAVGQSPQALVATAGAVWVSVAASPAIPKSSSGSPTGVLRVVRECPFASTDPALTGENLDLQSLQLYYATCAGLLSYPDRPAPQGTHLVPEVAGAMPTVSADGRTYTFTVRPGFRFSPPSDAPVTAATFKHTIERTLGPKLHAYARDIHGRHCWDARLPGRKDSSPFRSDRPRRSPPDSAHQASARSTGSYRNRSFLRRSDDTPATAQSQAIPSAGPYYIVCRRSRPASCWRATPTIASADPHPGADRVSFWRGAAARGQAGPRRARATISTLNGLLGASDPAAAPAVLQTLENRYGPASAAPRTGQQRYFVNPWMDVEYLVFNTARPLFASARLRRAVNYALDRRALVQHHFALLTADAATDHYLVPGIPGYRPVDIYPLGGPDLAKARAAGRRCPRPRHAVHRQRAHRSTWRRPGSSRPTSRRSASPSTSPRYRVESSTAAWQRQASHGTSPG